MDRAIFLDRDGTLIDNDGDLANPDLVQLAQGAAAAVASLQGLGYKTIVVTNQGGVARGNCAEADVELVHERINELIRAKSNASIDRFYFCPYHPDGKVPEYAKEHPWRKPQSGMLLQAADDLDLNLSRCWMIGDQVRDVEAGRGVGARTILIIGNARDVKEGREKADFLVSSLIEAVRIVGQQPRPDPTPTLDRVESQTSDGKHSDEREPTQHTHDPLRLDTTTQRSAHPPSSLASDSHDLGMNAAGVPVADQQNGPDTGTPTSDVPPPANQTLRQILHELRHQRAVSGDMSYVAILAIVLQMVTIVCLLAALLIGRDDLHTFVRWMFSAVLIQLTTIAMLLFRR